MPNVTYKPFVLNVIMLSAVRQNVVMLIVVAPISRGLVGWGNLYLFF